MSKKRTSDEFNNDEQALFENQDNVKRANVDSKSDTTLQDLPMELLECILVKVVATEVIGLKLVKSVWKERADQRIGRLGTVCPQWSHILSTNSFRTKLNRILDGTAQEKTRLEVLHTFPAMHPEICAVTTMNDEIFALYKSRDPRNESHAVHMYERNNMTRVKAVIRLPGDDPVSIAACNVSNCVYVGLENKCGGCLTVLRISKVAEHQFSISPWIEDHRPHIFAMSVTANGNLIMISEKNQWEPQIVSMYDGAGILRQEIRLSQVIDTRRYKGVFQRANGNFVLAYDSKQTGRMTLSEIDMSGSVVRQYQSPHTGQIFLSFADMSGRIVLADPFGRIEVLDSEFNLQDTYSLQQDPGEHLFLVGLHYDSERNEILRIHYDWNTGKNALTSVRFTD